MGLERIRDEASPPGGLRRAFQTACIVAVVGAALWTVADAALQRAASPAQLNFVEGFIVADALRIAEGGPLYNDPRQLPHTVNVYAPLYTVMLAGAAKSGVDPFLTGRLLALAGTLAIALAVVAFGWRRSPALALTAASLFLLAPLQWPWSLVLRPDTLAVALSVAGVAIAARRGQAPPPPLALLLLLAAFFTKQTAVAGAVAVVLAAARSQPRRALGFAAVGVAVGAAVALALEWTSGGWFLFHTVTANLNPFPWQRAGALWLLFLGSHAVEMSVLAVLIVVQAVRRRMDAVGLYALLACLTATSAGKVGSDLNYFLEPLAAAALLAAHAWPLGPPARQTGVFRIGRTAVLVGVAVLGIFHSRDQLQRRAPLAAAGTAVHEVIERVRDIDGPVVSDDASLLVRAGKPVLFQPFVMTQLAEAGRWEERPIVEALREGKVQAVIVQTAPAEILRSRYSAAMREALGTRYRMTSGFVLGYSYGVLEPL